MLGLGDDLVIVRRMRIVELQPQVSVPILRPELRKRGAGIEQADDATRVPGLDHLGNARQRTHHNRHSTHPGIRDIRRLRILPPPPAVRQQPLVICPSAHVRTAAIPRQVAAPSRISLVPFTRIR